MGAESRFTLVACHEHGAGLSGFLPGSWHHLACQSWDHRARWVLGFLVRSRRQAQNGGGSDSVAPRDNDPPQPAQPRGATTVRPCEDQIGTPGRPTLTTGE